LDAATPATATSFEQQPVRRVSRDGAAFVLLGTAHVSRASVEAVQSLLAHEPFDAVAVELCPHREKALRDPDAIAHMDLLRVLREGRAGVVAASLALAAYQRRIAAQFGVEPGAEMCAAMVGAEQHSIPYWLIDRDVGTTLRRARAAVNFWQRAQLTAGLALSVLEDQEVEEAEIEKLKQGDLLQSTFSEFAKQSPALYDTLIGERDRYMAARLRQQASVSGKLRILAVVGAGHLEGIARELESGTIVPDAVLELLGREPPPSKFARWFGIALLALLLGGFVWAFGRGRAVGMDVVTIWVLYTAVGGALGALAAAAHPLSILVSALVSPITPFHLALSSGMVSGATELWLRRPQVGDFALLRDDLGTVRGWWRNRVSRVFLTFMLSNVGTALGVWIAGARMATRLAQ
jgi:pheromone shutdown-related protein TraB